MHKPDRSSLLAHRQAGPRTQRGQSLVEVAIACAVLVPMFLGVMLLGQYIHVRQQTQAAARAAAWDAATSPRLVGKVGGMPSSETAQDRMRVLQFGAVDAKLTRLDPPKRLADPMLTTFAGRDLILAKNVTLSTYRNETSPALSEKILGPLGKATGAVGLGNFPPDDKGFITAEVHAKPERLKYRDGKAAKLLDPLDSMDLDFHGRTVLLADTWNADGAGESADGKARNDTLRSVRHAIKPLTPSEWAGDSFDGGISDFIDILGKIPIVDVLFTAGWDQFRLGKTGADVVPADKLVRYGSKP